MNSIPLFPLGRAIFPDGILNLRVFEIRYFDMVKKCLTGERQFGVVQLLQGNEVRTPDGHETLGLAGTLVKIESVSTPMPGLMLVRCIGTTRFTLATVHQEKFGLWVGHPKAEIPADEPVAIPIDLQPCANTLGRLIADLQKEAVSAEAMPIAAPFRLDQCGWVANRWAEVLPMAAEQRQALLTLVNPLERLANVRDMLVSRGILP